MSRGGINRRPPCSASSSGSDGVRHELKRRLGRAMKKRVQPTSPFLLLGFSAGDALEAQFEQPPDSFGARWLVRTPCRPIVDTRPQLSRKPD